MRDPVLDAIIGPPDHSPVPLETLIPRRIQNILLVSSLYDSFTFVEEGQLTEVLYSEYLELNLRYAPRIDRVSTAREALEALRTDTYQLVISMAHVGEMNVTDFGQAVKELDPELPLVLLAHNTRELGLLQSFDNLPGVRGLFVWMGDATLFLAIVKAIEDKLNAWHDARAVGLKVIILIEDSIPFYSVYLPMLYTELMKQTQALMAEGVNRHQRIIRMRARPKILLAQDYEQGMELYERYKDDLLGVILDASFPREGELDRGAGARYARMLKKHRPDIPVLMQSGSPNAEIALDIGVQYVDKASPNLLEELRGFMQANLGFGDFVFRRPDGSMVSRAADLRNMEWAIQVVPDECLLFHAARDDFSTWLMARTEFDLANKLRPRKVAEFAGAGEIRSVLLTALRSRSEASRAGIVAEFSGGTFEGGQGFVRIGAGSLGGKGRGLAFINNLISAYDLDRHFEGIRIFVPPTAVLATDVFDRFMESSRLKPMALEETNDAKIQEAFLEAELPEDVVDNLWTFLDWVRYPLAVRSSSLLEDASYQPFAGIYHTYMIPNNSDDPEERLSDLVNAIKSVYASIYYRDSKAYMESTANRLEEEKMAVIIQQVVGRSHEGLLYPDFAGVARSLNYYPTADMKPEDGVASVALGLGRMVVDGGRCMRFCPAHPHKPIQSFTPDDWLDNSQRNFYALDTNRSCRDDAGRFDPLSCLVSPELDTAERHGTLAPLGSVYDAANDRIYDGIGRAGVRLVTLAGVLKRDIFPLPKVLSFLMKVGAAASSCPVEMEFAVNLSDSPDAPHEFAFLQIRPVVLFSESQDIDLEDIDESKALCVSHEVLGNGPVHGVRDVLYVRPDRFDRGKTVVIARELGELNDRLRMAQQPYLLIGPGRWGSADPWLGIPVTWAEMSGVRCIVETDFADIHVTPSQGSHFFQNITSFGIGYLTVNKAAAGRIDYDWLQEQEACSETVHLRHIRFDEPLEIALNGRKSFGVVLKPGERLVDRE